MITERQFAAARRHSWLRAVYYHNDIVQQILAAPDVASDSNITVLAGTANHDVEVPDAQIGAGLPLDVVPDTPVSKQGHLGRAGIDDRQQLLTYPSAAGTFLGEIFDAETTPNAADS